MEATGNENMIRRDTLEGRVVDSNNGARAPKEESRGLSGWLAGKYNRLHRTIAPARVPATASRDFRFVCDLASIPSDINEHLELMFVETLLLRPRLILELGVRGGASTNIFQRAAAVSEARIISVDIAECSAVSQYQLWEFVHSDDIEFAGRFSEFCRRRDIPPCIDLLFIDTSHYYDHSAQEIEAWFPFLSPRGKVIFHDTNLRMIGPRRDGCFQLSWDNQRGVIRAIEDYLGVSIDESKPFSDQIGDWMVRHWPNCNGLTIMDRIGQTSQ
ncbi:MAG TPA: class I SAM-dependent methyltransferase [Terracidiphilus sp.]|jgi:predicted O-methyltransferase YrrM